MTIPNMTIFVHRVYSTVNSKGNSIFMFGIQKPTKQHLIWNLKYVYTLNLPLNAYTNST